MPGAPGLSLSTQAWVRDRSRNTPVHRVVSGTAAHPHPALHCGPYRTTGGQIITAAEAKLLSKLWCARCWGLPVSAGGR